MSRLRTWLEAAISRLKRVRSGRMLLARGLYALARATLRAAVSLRGAARALEAGAAQGPREPWLPRQTRRLAQRWAQIRAKAGARRAQDWLDLSPNQPQLLVAVDGATRTVALWGGGLALALLMTVTVLDVVGRYWLNAPLTGALDLSSIMLVLIVACAIAYAGRSGAHVTADMITTLGSPGFERATAIAIKLLACLVTATWSWRLYVTGGVAGQLGEGTQLLNIPYEPIYKVMSMGVGLYSVAFAIEAALLIYRGDAPVLDAEREPPAGGSS
jgi:TRAP-type C4-dicarboxylate transport system permease small subunit